MCGRPTTMATLILHRGKKLNSLRNCVVNGMFSNFFLLHQINQFIKCGEGICSLTELEQYQSEPL